MKNKRLLLSLVAIFGLLIFAIYQENSASNRGNNHGIKKIGVLQFVSHPALDQIYQGIKVGLADEGLTEDTDYQIIFKNGQADQSKLSTMSEEIIQQNPQAVIGIATPAAQALANQTKTIPIILGAITDPVAAKLVKNERRPGANITGVSDQSPVLAQINFAKEILPQAKKIGILYSSAEDNSKAQVEEIEKFAQKDGLKVKSVPVPSTNEVNSAVEVLAQEVDFIYVPNDNTMASAMPTIVAKATENKIAVIPAADTMVKDGGLATVGINQKEIGVQTGKMTAEIIMEKKKPATTPIYTFKTGNKIINLTQAKKLGIVISDKIKNDQKIKKVGK